MGNNRIVTAQTMAQLLGNITIEKLGNAIFDENLKLKGVIIFENIFFL